MDYVVINLYGIPMWILFSLLGYWCAGWQIQHVWHFHPFVVWFICHFWQSAIVVAFLNLLFEITLLESTLYFMGVLLFLSWLRVRNPINANSIMSPKRIDSFSIQDKETYWLALFHFVALSLLL